MKSNSRRHYLALALVLVRLFAAGSTAWAQTAGTGALTGTVTDVSGGTVADVEVTVSSEATGVTRKVLTGTDGIYRVPGLPPGLYRVQATGRGFKLASRLRVEVSVTETARLDIKLEIGTASESVTVESQVVQVDTESNALGSTTNERSVKSLPLVTRNFTQIIGLNPGVSVGVTDASQLGLGNGGASNISNEDPSVNGARSSDNNFQMDGVTANEIGGVGIYSGGVAIPNPDSIAEFKVQTGQYDASHGRNAGASVDVVTKSGSNEFHGNLFEFFRNEVLNANNFFFNAAGVPRGLQRQNQFGGTIGGPIKRDKLLFFASYQGTRQTNGVASSCSSSFVGPPLTNNRSAAALGAIYGGQSGLLGGVAIAPDGSNLNPVTLKLLNLKLPDGTYVIPTPQKIANGEGIYAYSAPCTFKEDQFVGNVDYLQSAKSRLVAKYFFANQHSSLTLPYGGSGTNGQVPGAPETIPVRYNTFSLTHEYVFSPTLLNQLEFGFHRTADRTNPSSTFSWSDIGVASIPNTNAYPVFVLPGTEGVGDYFKSYMYSNSYTLQDTFTFTRGRHSFRFGGGATRTDFSFNWTESSFLLFLSWPDVLLGQSAAQNGSSFSNVYGSFDIPGQTNRNLLQWNPWLYAQDDFKVNRRLTLNLGLRYERIGDFSDKNGRAASFNMALADHNPPASGSQAGYVVGSNFPSTVPIPTGSIRLNNAMGIYGDGQNTFGPRVGFAWQVFPRSNHFVLRGGYGIYYSSPNVQQASQNAFVPPWAIERFITGTPNAGASFATPFGQLLAPSDFPFFPSYSPSTLLNTRFPALDYRPAINQQYSLNLQTQLADNFMLEVGYVGARATHLVELASLNQAELASPSNPIRGETTNTLANLQLRVPVEGFIPSGLQAVQSAGASWYNALNVSLNKRFSRGLQFQASYTFSRLLDTEGGGTVQTGAGSTLLAGDQNDLRARYGPSSTVRPHRLVVSFVYDLPKFVGEGVGAKLVNNWSLSGVTTFQSGHPLTIMSYNATNVFGINGLDKAQFAPGCNKSKLETPGSVNSKLHNYFNLPCIGSFPVVGSDGVATGFGNMGPGLVNGPDQRNFDLALTKRFPVGWFHRESDWEFRAEFFNAFNTSQFMDPDTTVSDGPAFGHITGTLVSPRIIQFALKYNF